VNTRVLLTHTTSENLSKALSQAQTISLLDTGANTAEQSDKRKPT